MTAIPREPDLSSELGDDINEIQGNGDRLTIQGNGDRSTIEGNGDRVLDDFEQSEIGKLDLRGTIQGNGDR